MADYAIAECEAYDEVAMIKELQAAGFSEAQIAREVAYMRHLAKEAEFLRNAKEANFGIFS